MENAMTKFELNDARKKAILLLDKKVSSVQVRPVTDFKRIDDSVFYAERGGRAFTICIISDVSWEAPVSSYVEDSDDMRHTATLMVDVANSIDGNENDIIELYNKWFGGG